MEEQKKAKTKRKTATRNSTASSRSMSRAKKSQDGHLTLPILNELPIQETVLGTKRAIRTGTRFVSHLVEKTGIPEGYSGTVAWFAERMILAMLCISTASFAGGVLFVLKWSEPIAESNFYYGVSRSAQVAQEGVISYSQDIIDVASPIFGNLIIANRRAEELEPSAGETLAAERLERKEKLKSYLTEKKSPFAEDEDALDAFANSRNMKLMVAISFVESTFGKNCYYYNCSGIGGTPPNLRKYNNYAEWIRDFDDLLERRYKNLPPEKFIGLYVQPGSPSWLYGVKQVIKEFEERGIEA
jgi:hypothetical protein